MASEKSDVIRKTEISNNYKLGKLIIRDKQCDDCICKHTILTCEKYCGTIPKSILQYKKCCEFYKRDKEKVGINLTSEKNAE